ncbi:MAG: tRNA (cytidine(34)-2'-O)-methyltransferase [Myxococcales bacterium]|nr:tRNA (cytidine(34)-2'-O)-methyltransferase [Myxococcales bacterium]
MSTRKLSSPPIAHVVMAQPEIPWNTGNAGRSCLAFGAQLHLIEPLGFSLENKAVKRAGLDYWQHVHPKLWSNWSDLASDILGDHQEPWLVTPEGAIAPWEAGLGPEPMLIFGSETKGIPSDIRELYPHRLLGIPMAAGPIRSLNVSTTIGIMLYEVIRLQSQA